MKFYQPKSPQDRSSYYDLRWRLLRKPWNQPPGSEKDEFEKPAYHILAIDDQGEAVGVGRIHCLDDKSGENNIWQVRYMGVIDKYRNKGIGSRILYELEMFAQAKGARQILLNAREGSLEFYLKKNYQVIGDAPTLYDTIKHKKMLKVI